MLWPSAMRIAAAVFVFAACACAQFRSTVPLVVAPTTITDAKGRFADGLDPRDLVLFDNNVPCPIQVDSEAYPISLVVAVQTSRNAEGVLDKLGRSGILFSQLLAGNGGDTAVVSFSDRIRLLQDFTTDSGELTVALRHLRVDGAGAVSLDALMEALRMLRQQPVTRRRIILMVAEKRVRSATVKLDEVVHEVERQNALIYWLTYSPMLTAFTARPKKIRCDQWGTGCEVAPPNAGAMDLITGFAELYHLTKPDVAELFAAATGARTINFLKREGLEDAIQAIGEEVHRQYIVTYQPAGVDAGKFHPLRVEVKNHPGLQARTRAGYWTVQ